MPGLMGLDHLAKFNGTIEVQGQKLAVQNGVVQIGQRAFYVNKKGTKLLDQANQPIASIDNGKVNIQQLLAPPGQQVQ